MSKHYLRVFAFWAVLATAVTTAPVRAETIGASTPLASQARVLSIKAAIGRGNSALLDGADVVTLRLKNATKRNYVKVSLVAFDQYLRGIAPTVLKTSQPAIHVPKPGDNYLFRLAHGQTKDVTFTIRSVGAVSYCIGNDYYQTATGVYTKCAK